MRALAMLRRAAWVVPLQLLLLIVLLELGAVLVRPFLDESLVGAKGEAETTAEPALGESVPHGMPTEFGLVHPYLGFVQTQVEGNPTNEFGFVGPSPLVRRAPDRVNVVLLGGSVALHLYRIAGDDLRRTLAASGAFGGKDVHVVSLALPGYKQPQQLLALSYLLYRGAQYDVVVNLDGFNEIVLPMTDNLPYGTSLHHPRRWWLYEKASLSVAEATQIAEIAELREDRRRWREVVSSPALGWSSFVALVGDILDARLAAELLNRDREYRAAQLLGQAPETLDGYGESAEEMRRQFLEAGQAWARASWQMHKLAAAHGFDYVHFLQPNQYVPGSKPLSARERRIAHIDGFAEEELPYHPSVRAYKPAVEAGYPILQAAGRHLGSRGVDFVDLTGIFEATTDTLYDDACCHLNREGYARLARRMAEHITSPSTEDDPPSPAAAAIP